MLFTTNRVSSLLKYFTLAAIAMFAFSQPAIALDLDNSIRAEATQGCAKSVSPPAPNSRRAADSLLVLPPAKGAYLGAYQIPANPPEVDRFRQSVGVMPPIVFSFHDLFSESNNSTRPDKTIGSAMEGEGSLTPLAMATHLYQRESVLALAWSVYCCDIEKTSFWLRIKKPHNHINRILAGKHDDFFRDAARRIAKWGGPVMLTLVPEMNWQGQFLFGANGRKWMDAADNICNQYGDPAWPDGPERIRDLYIRVIDIFRQEGANNVTWFMYSGNQYMAPGVEGQSQWLHPKYYYPGDAYIDWVGQSVYFTDPAWGHDFEDTGSFNEVFLPGYKAWRSVTHKPMMLPEFGILSEPDDDRRALWAKTLNTYLKSTPGVKAVTIADSELFALYFNIPVLSKNAAETNTVRAIRENDGYYRSKLRLGRGG